MIYTKTIVTGLNRFYRGHFQNAPNIKTFFIYAIRFIARTGHRVSGHILGLGYTCTCILLVKLIKRLQNIIHPDALFLYVGQPIKTRKESNIPYLSVFPICSVLPLKGRPNIKLINTCSSRLIVLHQLAVNQDFLHY